jgi:hypothetical protein
LKWGGGMDAPPTVQPARVLAHEDVKTYSYEEKEKPMPSMTYTPRTYNDPSNLTMGWHPAFLLEIADEPTPDTWQMFAKSPRMYRWRFAVWEVPTLIPTQAPERQSAVSSQTFSPKGRQPASKAYTWTVALLGRQIAPGESVNLDPLMPLPVRVKVERKEQYANIIDVEACPELAQYLTPELKQRLAVFLQTFGQAPEGAPPLPAPVPTPAPPQPGMQTWGSPPPAERPATVPAGQAHPNAPHW